jgi:hypothetical protein
LKINFIVFTLNLIINKKKKNIKFLEKDWAFPNFDLIVSTDNPMLHIDNKIIERHGK